MILATLQCMHTVNTLPIIASLSTDCSYLFNSVIMILAEKKRLKKRMKIGKQEEKKKNELGKDMAETKDCSYADLTGILQERGQGCGHTAWLDGMPVTH